MIRKIHYFHLGMGWATKRTPTLTGVCCTWVQKKSRSETNSSYFFNK
jgi:hypothetical protein